MAFRKRNLAIAQDSAGDIGERSARSAYPGIRPSPLTSRPVTSTGTPSLDDSLGGHGGLALGSSLLVEESGTTDFAGALLRFYAAQGICQGDVVHLIGAGEAWARSLPGVADDRSRRKEQMVVQDERMQIAWRYGKQGLHGEKDPLDRKSTHDTQPESVQQRPFCHSFDLSKRMVISPDVQINHIRNTPSPRPSDSILHNLTKALNASDPGTMHRIIIPTILSPALWPPNASRPENVIQFLHGLRSLLSQHPGRLTAIISLPLELHPRGSGLVRWMEILSDGVMELTPFPHLMDAVNNSESGGTRANDEQPQGMVKFHKLPIVTERGEGGAGAANSIGDDLAFTVSRRKFLIKPFSLPPLEGDQKDAAGLATQDVEF